jgi:hypothetical protein
MNTKSLLGGAIVGGIIVYILMQKKCKKCGEKIQGEPTTTFLYPPMYYAPPPPPPIVTTSTSTPTTTLAPTGGGTVLTKNFVGFTGLKGIM